MLRQPIIHVAHASAVAFCDWLTEKERLEGRIGSHERYALPTLAQWQAFSQGIKVTAKTVIERQWQSGQFQPTEPVDWPDPGPLGLLCLLGNVFEWCGDSPQERPLKKQRADGTVARWKQACYAAVGGGWASGCQWLDEELRKGTGGRIWCPDGVAMKDGGFRICLQSEEPASTAG
jgi:formylglycine-generating enzyme required for sulfatase activity